MEVLGTPSRLDGISRSTRTGLDCDLLGYRCKVFRTRGLTPPPGAVVVHSDGAYNTADWQPVVLNIELLIILHCVYLPPATVVAGR